MNASDTEETYTADCGHEVTRENRVTMPEIMLCQYCYIPFSVDKWPKTLSTSEEYAGTNYHGSAEYTKYHTTLLGLDARGRAVYHHEENRTIEYIVPMNDDAYRQDRQARAKQLLENQTPAKGMGVLQPVEKRSWKTGMPYANRTIAALPNNDHMVVVKVEDVDFGAYDTRGIQSWLQENADDWSAVRPELVKMFNLQEQFGEHSGRPMTHKECENCGHEAAVDPVKHTECPDCGSHRFYGKTGVR